MLLRVSFVTQSMYSSMHIEDHGMIYARKMIMLVKSYKNV